MGLCEAADYPGGGATSAGMGHIAVMDDSEAQFQLTTFSQRLWNELAADLPSCCEFINCGSLWIAADEQEYAEVERKHDFYSSRGIAAEKLDPAQLAQAEPCLRQGLAGALLLPNDSVCYPPCVSDFFIEEALKLGGEALFKSPVRSVSDRGAKLEDGRHIDAGVTVVACGIASAVLTPSLEMQPRKGHLVITDRYPNFLRHQVIELGYLKSAHSFASDSVAFNAQPRQTGQILIGSSRQLGVHDPEVESAMLTRMLARAAEFIPALASMTAIRAWAGFRAATPDKLPVIGVAPGMRNVYLATGHEGLGISTSLATARLIADEVLGRKPAIPPEAYGANRTFAHA